MMDALDRHLRDLAGVAVPDALATLDDRVFAGIRQHDRDSRQARALSGAAVSIALLLGVAGGLTIERPVPAGPFDSALAPSTLLIAAR